MGKIISSIDDVEIWYVTKVDGYWESSRKLTIEGITGSMGSPVFLDNPDEMYFMNLNDSGTFHIYKVTRTDNIWGNPELVDIPVPPSKVFNWAFSIANNLNVYFTLSSTFEDENSKIYVSKYNNGAYGEPEALGFNDDSYGTSSPSIAPDESYIVFDTDRPNGYGYHDIYISYLDEFGHFGTPVNMGNLVNTDEEELLPIISRDGKFLFFIAKRTTDVFWAVYWISINELSVINID